MPLEGAMVDSILGALILIIMCGDLFVDRARISQRLVTPYRFRRDRSAGAWFFLSLGFLGGCSEPAGRWQLVEVDPPGAAFPITQIEFGEGGAYRSKGQFTPEGEPTIKTQSATGKFSRQDGLLHLAPTGRGGIGFSTRLRLDGRMIMTLQPPGRDWKVHGIFERVTPVDERLLAPGKPITPESLGADGEKTSKE